MPSHVIQPNGFLKTTVPLRAIRALLTSCPIATGREPCNDSTERAKAQRDTYEELGSFEVGRVDRRQQRRFTEVIRLVHTTSSVANDHDLGLQTSENAPTYVICEGG